MRTRITFFQRIIQFISAHSEQVAHERTRRYLIGLSDRTLEDLGFSRELLQQGAKAWPWRLPAQTDGARAAYLHASSAQAEPQAPFPSPRIEPIAQVTAPDLDVKQAA